MELAERDGQVAGKCEIPDLGVAAEFHGHIHQAAGVGPGLAEPDMEDIPAVHDREEDMLDLHPLCERDICAGCDVGTVRIVDGEVAALPQPVRARPSRSPLMTLTA